MADKHGWYDQTIPCSWSTAVVSIATAQVSGSLTNFPSSNVCLKLLRSEKASLSVRCDYLIRPVTRLVHCCAKSSIALSYLQRIRSSTRTLLHWPPESLALRNPSTVIQCGEWSILYNHCSLMFLGNSCISWWRIFFNITWIPFTSDVTRVEETRFGRHDICRDNPCPAFECIYSHN